MSSTAESDSSRCSNAREQTLQVLDVLQPHRAIALGTQLRI